MFAAGEEPNEERVNTYRKPKIIESILEALDPEEAQPVVIIVSDTESESAVGDSQAEEDDEEVEQNVSVTATPPAAVEMISMIEDTTHSTQDLVWEDEVEDETVDKLV
ncbi:unnamed protein product, partial [Brassica napus]